MAWPQGTVIDIMLVFQEQVAKANTIMHDS